MSKDKMPPKPENNQDDYLTTNQGLRLNNTDNSLKAGDRGPTLMEDFHFREKMTHFDHENIPERIVHARGSGVHGFFQPYESMAEFTKAGFLQDPSVKTPVFVRFSTVVGNKGSADTVRDVRGFATKFYTQEGNYDLVGNNMPPFFIQDGIKFPDLVHSIKPDPDSHMPQASAAHDTFWDFASLMPESMHMIMWVLSDRAIPRSFRMMEGFGVHTFRFINEKGKARFVKFHWRPTIGSASLVWDEAQKLAGKDPDFLRRDLWEAVEMGNYPEFELGVQIVEEEDEMSFAFDLLDATKLIPEELVPIKFIGKMTLNRNPDNFFAETEQVAFHPGNLVPGIDVTNDPLLQGRLFSYLDTQLNRFNSANFHEVPINRPKCPVHNNQQDGFMRQTVNKGKVNYFPNTLGGGCPMHAPEKMGGYVHYMEKVDGRKIRERSESFKDHYSQATLFWNSMSPVEKKHIVEAAHFELGKVETKAIRERMLAHFHKIDPELARRTAAGIGVDVPKKSIEELLREVKQDVDNDISKPLKGKSVDKSAALSMENAKKYGTKTRKVAVLLADGYNHRELTEVKEALMEKGVQVKVISKFLGTLKSEDGQKTEVDKSQVTAGSIMFDAVFVPGGKASVEALKKQGDAIHFLNEAFKHCKPIGATGEAVTLLAASDVAGVTLSSEAKAGLQQDSGVVSQSQGADLKEFNQAFLGAIAEHRHWNREEKDIVPA